MKCNAHEHRNPNALPTLDPPSTERDLTGAVIIPQKFGSLSSKSNR